MYFSKETEKSLYLILKPLKILQTLQKNAYSRIIIVTLQTHILQSHYKNGSNKDNYQSGKGKGKPPTVTRLTAMHRKRPVPESLLNKVFELFRTSFLQNTSPDIYFWKCTVFYNKRSQCLLLIIYLKLEFPWVLLISAFFYRRSATFLY